MHLDIDKSSRSEYQYNGFVLMDHPVDGEIEPDGVIWFNSSVEDKVEKQCSHVKNIIGLFVIIFIITVFIVCNNVYMGTN